MTLKWNSSLETGNERIDEQHKNLFKKFVEFEEAINKGPRVIAVVELFNFIDSYVQQHFVLEEAYMFGNKYPELEPHRKAHRELRVEYRRISEVLETSDIDAIMALKANRFLGAWWMEHISKVDKKMVTYIAKHRKK
jgi:hemerythrin